MAGKEKTPTCHSLPVVNNLGLNRFTQPASSQGFICSKTAITCRLLKILDAVVVKYITKINKTASLK